MRPWEITLLTETQLGDLLAESNWILYLRDRAMRDYHFMKLDKAALAGADPKEPLDPTTAKAREVFLGVYDLPEHRTKRMTKRAARDLWRAIQAGRVPRWVLAVAPPLAEIEEQGGEKK